MIIKLSSNGCPTIRTCAARARVAGTREAVVHPNYILVYRVTGEAVEIVRLVHSRQQYP